MTQFLFHPTTISHTVCFHILTNTHRICACLVKIFYGRRGGKTPKAAHTYIYTGSDSSDVMTNEPARRSRLLSPRRWQFFSGSPPGSCVSDYFSHQEELDAINIRRERKRVLFYDLPGVWISPQQQSANKRPNDLCKYIFKYWCKCINICENEPWTSDGWCRRKKIYLVDMFG